MNIGAHVTIYYICAVGALGTIDRIRDHTSTAIHTIGAIVAGGV